MGFYYPSGPSTVNPLLFTVTLGRAMNNSNYKSTMAVEHLYAELDSSHRFYINFMLDSKAMGSFKFNIISTSMNKIQSMRFRYMVIDSNWGNFAGFWFQYTAIVIVTSSSSYTWADSGLTAINMTGTVRTFSVFTGFDITAINTFFVLDLKLTVTRTTSTSIQGVISSSSTTGTLLNY
jgi:hypothetical protein